MNPALLPYAVTFTALYLGLGLLPFAPAGIGWGEALALWSGQLFAAGMALWWLLAKFMTTRLSGPPGALWPLLVVFAALCVLLPLDMGALIGDLTLSGGLSTYVVDIPQRIYLLIKSAILWAPIGLAGIVTSPNSSIASTGGLI